MLLLENRLIRRAFTSERLDGVKLIAGQLAVSLENAQLYAELTASRARIVAAADQTRRRIERDLHDGAQQRLVSLALRLRVAQAAVPPDSTELAVQLDSLVGEAISTLDELRELARGIHPVVLAEGGLCPALETLARRSAVPAELHCGIDGRLPEQVEIAAYYVVSEALTNAAKHAEASMVQIQVDTVEGDGTDVLRVEIRDDGRGGADLARGTGLLGLKDRVGGARRADPSRQPARCGHHPAPGAPPHRRERRRHLPLARRIRLRASAPPRTRARRYGLGGIRAFR